MMTEKEYKKTQPEFNNKQASSKPRIRERLKEIANKGKIIKKEKKTKDLVRRKKS